MEIKIFKRKKSFKKGGLHINPDIFWEAVLYIGFFIVIVSCFFGFYIFRTINQKFFLSEEESESFIKTVRKERIDKTLDYFSEKQQKSNQIINSPSPIVDPSR